MKLAEALQARADLNRDIEQLNRRILNNCLVQEGEKPNEDPNELLKQLDKNIRQLKELIARINRTNTLTLVEGKSLTEMIAERDGLVKQIDVYKDILNMASSNTSRATRTEIKILPAIDVQANQKKVDRLAKELRVLDNKIQQANWLTDLK